MKIISWNIDNFSFDKLSDSFTPTFSSFGLGNDVGSYILNFIIGSDIWNNISGLSTKATDVFVITGLATGGNEIGDAVSGTCLPTLTALRDNLNLAAEMKYGDNSTYQYEFVVPKVTGKGETIGIIYNTCAVSFKSFDVFQDLSSADFIPPRTPAGAQFQVIEDQSTFQVIGIHAPDTNGDGYQEPIEYCNVLHTIEPASSSNTFFLGDFNCNPGSSYQTYSQGANTDIYPFKDNLFKDGYQTNIPNGSLSGVRQTLDTTASGQESYLKGAYDNIIFNKSLTNSNSNQLVVDLIGNARDMNASGTPTKIFGTSTATSTCILTAFNQVSDHLPVGY